MSPMFTGSLLRSFDIRPLRRFVRRARALTVSARVLDNKSGAEINPGSLYFPDLIQANADRRHWKIPFRWMFFEVAPGVYVLEPEVQQALALLDGAEVYLSIKTTPAFYREYPDHNGSIPKKEHWRDFGRAIVEAMRLTGAKYVEIGNEPNYRVTDVSNSSQLWYGAYVGPFDTLYDAGYRYGQMLKVIRPMVQNQIPGGDIIAGALAYPNYDDDSQVLEFVRGMVDSGFSAKAVSMHGYVSWDPGSDDNFILPIYAARKIKSLTGLPVLFSEAALILNDQYQEGPMFRDAQARFVAFLENEKYDFTWYSWSQGAWSWMHSSLIRGSQRGMNDLYETPAYVEWAN